MSIATGSASLERRRGPVTTSTAAIASPSAPADQRYPPAQRAVAKGVPKATPAGR
jgi:hypothetical protein